MQPGAFKTQNLKSMKSIMNGGIELGILQIVGDENLSDADKHRKAYLESLPKGKWIYLDDNGLAITDEQVAAAQKEELARYGIK